MERQKPQAGAGGSVDDAGDSQPQPRAQSGTAPITAEETQQLLRRAAELEREKQKPAPEVSLDWHEVERIAMEAGLSRESIQRAFAELRTVGLAPKPKAGLADRLIGPESITVHSLSPLPPEEARKKLHAILRAELLHPEARNGSRTTWTPASGLWASIQRGINFRGQAAWRREQVVSEVSEAPAGMNAGALIRLEASVGGRGMFLAPLAQAGVCESMAILAAFQPHAREQGIPLILGGIGAVIAGFTFTVARTQYRKRLRGVRAALERVLARLSGELEE